MSLALSCGSSKTTSNQIISDQFQKIESKLRISDLNTQPMGGKSKNLMYADWTKKFFNSTVIAQKIYLVDLNQDGFTDLVTLEEKYSSPRVHFFAPKVKKFVRSKLQIFPKGFKASFLYFDDFNKDGTVDVAAGQFFMNVQYNVPPAQVLYGVKQNGSPRFQVSQNIAPVGLPHSSFLAIDTNRDGSLEFLNTFWIGRKNGINQFYPPQFFSFRGNMVEVDENKSEIYKNGSASWSTELCDINNDSLSDILVANTSGHENYVLVAQEQSDGFISGHQKFENIIKDENGRGLILGNGNTQGYLCADLNNDSLLDLISYEEKRELQDSLRDPVRIHFQQRITDKNYPFYSEVFPVGAKNYSIKSIIDFDYDNDGDSDLLVSDSGYPPYSTLMLFENQDGQFINKSFESGINRLNPSGVNVVDLDGDGVLEIIVGQSRVRSGKLSGEVKIFKLKSHQPAFRSVEIFLQGIESNVSGIGAIISLKTKQLTKKSIVNYMRGGPSVQRARGIHFGLGKEKSADISIEWASKKLKPTKLRLEFAENETFKQISVCDDGRFFIGKLNCPI